MASGLIFTEGFGLYTQYTDMFSTTNGGKWFNNAVNGAANYTISTTYGLGGRKGMRMNTANTSSRFPGVVLPATYDELLIGVSIAAVSLPTERIMLSFGESGGNHMQLRVTTAGELRAYRNGTAIGTLSVPVLTEGSGHHYVWWRFRIHDTLGTSIITADGIELTNDSGLDTRNAQTGRADRFFLGHTSGAASSQEIWFADLCIADASVAGVNKLAANAVGVETIYPNANGFYNTAWPPTGAATRREAIDDQGLPDGDTTIITGEAVGDKVSVGLTSPVSTQGTIIGVVPYVVARKTDVGPGGLEMGFRYSSTDDLGDAVDYSAGNYQHKPGPVHDLAPDGGAWTYAKIDATELLINRAA